MTTFCTPEQAEKNRAAMAKMTATEWQIEFDHRVTKEIKLRKDCEIARGFYYPHELEDALKELRERVENYGHFKGPHYSPFRRLILAGLDMAIANVQLATR